MDIVLSNINYCGVFTVKLAELRGSRDCCDLHQIPSHSSPIGAIDKSRKTQ